jgi:hypothetical protein
MKIILNGKENEVVQIELKWADYWEGAGHWSLRINRDFKDENWECVPLSEIVPITKILFSKFVEGPLPQLTKQNNHEGHEGHEGNDE